MAQMKNRPKWPNGPYGQMAEKTNFCQMVRLVKWKNGSNRKIVKFLKNGQMVNGNIC